MKATNAERPCFREDKSCSRTKSYPSILTIANASNPPKAPASVTAEYSKLIRCACAVLGYHTQR